MGSGSCVPEAVPAGYQQALLFWRHLFDLVEEVLIHLGMPQPHPKAAVTQRKPLGYERANVGPIVLQTDV